ncbi:MAG: L-2-amino-thiazoline-4-carboxylic acid hydrolase [Bacteroidales bacterium]|nr:L-2-amino-thiazoline-4-carboxylic acid hydrolase [Lachnoclostridium sp.]MCM1384015.1 L-2-amino-thiazoline-4-carboxylic acid hydrolase [Lachnoclostridium sp.]MCM1466471.1 L-2-amino-thiazoline-4-carboxylic acid hydrolase [Bacteroidales bacterium]
MKRKDKEYSGMIRQVRPVLVRRYGEREAERLLRDMEPIYDRFLAETPFIGGKENLMSKNLDMAIPFFALYEASGKTLSADVVNEMLDMVMVSRYRKIGRFINFNHLDKPWIIKRIHRLMEKVVRKINDHKGKDWNDTWGIQVNPEGHDHGLAMTLVGCPIADFAKKHGYTDILPLLCESDIKAAEALHARLIRHHTVAQGADSCDYWFVGDKEIG